MSAAPADRPVFVLGPHRSGTTLLYRVLSRHSQLGFLRHADRRLPAWPRLAHLWTRVRRDTAPVEAQKFWDLRWRQPDDVMTAADATPDDFDFYRSRIATTLELQGRARFVAKYPRLSLRVDWLDAVFPGARFLHVVRDWRAVLASTLLRKTKRERRGGGWFGVRIPGWQQMHDVSHDRAAARQFRAASLALEEAAARHPDRFLRVHYSALCRDPEGVLTRVTDFCELPADADFAAAIPRDLRSADHKWKEQLEPARLEALRAEDPAFFERYEEDAR